MDFNAFSKDEKTMDAVVRNFEVIGEAARYIPDEVQKKYNEVPWEEMKGMRNVLIHEYFGVGIDMIWETVQKDVPVLLSAIKNLNI